MKVSLLDYVDAILSATVFVLVMGITALLLAGCTTERMTGTKNGTDSVPGYKQEGTVGWSWNQTPHGGNDEKSSVTTPTEPLR